MDESKERTFGALLRRFRRQKNLNQLGLAYKLGKKTRSSIDAWERGLYLPDTPETVFAIANALSLSERETDALLLAARYAPKYSNTEVTRLHDRDRLTYLEQVRQRYSSIKLPTGPAEGLSLRAIFQPLALRKDPLIAQENERRKHHGWQGEPDPREAFPREDLPQAPVIAENGDDALKQSPRGRIVILGGPGTGKTTTLKYLAADRAEKALAHPEAPLPLYLSLPDLARSDKLLPRYLVDLVEELGIQGSYAEVLSQHIDAGRAFLCLDGLDEMDPRHRSRMIDQINTWAGRSSNTWIVGSRFTEYKGGQFKPGQFAEWELLPMSHDLRLQLAQRLLPELQRLLAGPGEVPLLPEAFVTLLERHPQAAVWGKNPLLFSLAAVIFIATGGIPASRALLYRDIIAAVLATHEPDPAWRSVLTRMLTAFALWLHQTKGRTFSYDDLVTFLSDRRGTHLGEEMVKLVRRLLDSGMMEPVARDTYGFRHHTFQAYFAAVELAQRLLSPDLEVRQHTWDLAWSKRSYSRWTEVLLFMVGTLVYSDRREGVPQALRWLRELVRQREEDEGDIGNLGLTLALRSLPEISTRPSSYWSELQGEEIEETIITSWIAGLRESIGREDSPHSLQQHKLLHLSDEVSRLDSLAKLAVEKLLRCLHGKDGRVRRIALKALAPLQEHVPLESVLALLNDPDQYVLGEAVRWLGKTKARAPVGHLLNLLDHEDWHVRRAVEDALVACGEHVPVEQLQKALISEHWWTRTSAAKVLAQRGERITVASFLADLHESDWERRRRAVELFGLLGDDAPIEPLLSALGDVSWFVRSSASKSLEVLGERVPVEAVLQALHSANPDTRDAAADALAGLAKHIPVPTAPLVEALSDVDASVRSSIAQALSHVHVGVPVEPLLKALHDEDQYVRWFAADALVKIGTYPSGEQIVREIESHLVWMRLTAWQVLSLVGQHIPAEPLLAALTDALNDADPSIRAEAVKVFAQLGEHAPIEPIVQALHDYDPGVRKAAAEALGKMGKGVPIEPLLEAFHDQEMQVRQEVVRSLAMFSEQVPAEPFLQALHDERAFMRVAATNVLGELGTRAPIDSLLHGLHDPDPSVRSMAVWAVGQQTGRVPMEALVEALEDEQDMVRRQAVSVLGTLGNQAPVEQLLMMVQDTSKQVRSAAVRVLGKLAESIPLEPLLALVHHEDTQVRVAAFQIIGHLEQQVPLDLLSQAMNDQERQVRVAALHTAGKRGVRELLPNLFNLLENEEQEIRVAAVEALAQLAEDQPVEPLIQALLTMLDDQEKHGEIAVVRALGRLRVQAAIEPLCNILHNRDRPSARRAAVEALGEIGGSAAVEALLTLLGSEDRDVFLREAVVKSLGKLEEGLPTEPLRLALGDSEQRVRDAVVSVFQQRYSDVLCDLIPEAMAIVQGGASGRVLGSMAQGVIADTIGRLTCASPALLEQLTNLLDWPYWQVRMKAAQALGQLRRNIPDAAIRGLLHLLHDPQSRTVQQAAHDALAAILSLETGIEDD